MKKFLLFLIIIFLAYITAYYTTGITNGYTKIFDFDKISKTLNFDNTSSTEYEDNIEEISYLQIGIKKLNEKNYDDALSYFFDALNDNDNSENNYYIGHTYLFQEKYDDAEYYLDMAIEKDGKNPLIYLDKGIVLYNQKKYDDAINTLYFSTELNPELAKTYYYLSLCYEKNNQLEVALQSAETALEKDSLYADAWFKAGYIAFELDSFIISKKNYKKLIQIDSLNKYGLVNLGLTYSYLEKNDSALLYYNKTIKLYPKYNLVYNNKGYIFQKQGNYKEAIKTYSKALKLNEEDTRPLWNRGDCYFELKKYNDAINDFKKVYKINPDYFNTLYQIGECYEKLNDKTNALNYYKQYQAKATTDGKYYEEVANKINKLN